MSKTDYTMSNMVATLGENMIGFTNRQIQQAKPTRKSYHNVGTQLSRTLNFLSRPTRSRIVQSQLMTLTMQKRFLAHHCQV